MVLQEDACGSPGNSLWRGPLVGASIGCHQQLREVSVDGTHQQMLEWDTSLNVHVVALTAFILSSTTTPK
jgi:hypothetical protein